MLLCNLPIALPVFRAPIDSPPSWCEPCHWIPQGTTSLSHTLPQMGPWSPLEKPDPAMKRTYDGPPSGTGASQSWSGNFKGRAVDPYHRLQVRRGVLRRGKTAFLRKLVY